MNSYPWSLKSGPRDSARAWTRHPGGQAGTDVERGKYPVG